MKTFHEWLIDMLPEGVVHGVECPQCQHSKAIKDRLGTRCEKCGHEMTGAEIAKPVRTNPELAMRSRFGVSPLRTGTYS
jgi:ribosomal protein L37AE/L43A